MALNKSFVGRSYRLPWIYEVGRQNIIEFAYAVSDVNPVYRDPEAAKAIGHPDSVASPTFLSVLATRSHHVVTDDPDLGLDYSRMVHGAQRFVLHRPVRPGDRITSTAHVDDITSRAGNDYLVLRSEFATEEGEKVGTVIATLIVRGDGIGLGEGKDA